MEKRSEEVIQLQNNMAKKLEENNKLLQSFQETQKNMLQKLQEQHQEIMKLKLKLYETEQQTENKPDFQDAPTSSLLIGNVALTDVRRHLETGVEVTCLPDATLQNLQAAISKNNQMYKNIYLVTGNTCARNDAEALKHQYQEIIHSAMQKAKKTFVASILPTLEDEDVNDKTKHLNKTLQVLCHERGCEFVDNDRTFKYGDETVIDDCFDDVTEQLSEVGIKRLLRNLGLLSVKKKVKAT